MIAAVHGNFNELIYNNDLNEVLGGIQSTILSGNQDRKMRTERDKKSSFDIIIQINYNEKENRYEYIFIDNIDDNIDEILNKKYVKSNMRYIKNNKVYEIETFLN